MLVCYPQCVLQVKHWLYLRRQNKIHQFETTNKMFKKIERRVLIRSKNNKKKQNTFETSTLTRKYDTICHKRKHSLWLCDTHTDTNTPTRLPIDKINFSAHQLRRSRFLLCYICWPTAKLDCSRNTLDTLFFLQFFSSVSSFYRGTKPTPKPPKWNLSQARLTL